MLDNFETNLKPQAEPVAAGGQPVWACQDPAWDRCLAALAKDLVGIAFAGADHLPATARGVGGAR